MAASLPDHLRVEVQHDARIFTTFVFLNLTGYDEENAPAFHPVRARVREEMRGALPPGLIKECRDLRAAHEPDFGYVWLAMLTDGPPHFELVNVEAAAANLVPLVADFVRQAAQGTAGFGEPLRKLWALPAVQQAFESIRAEALAHAAAHARLLEPNVNAAIRYLHADQAILLTGYTVISNLLSSYWQGMGIQIGRQYYEIRGPVAEVPGTPDPHDTGDPHEFVHMLVSPTSWDPARVDPHAARLDELFRRAQQGFVHYGSFILFLNECLVDAVSCRVCEGPVPLAPIDDPCRPQVMEDARAGLLLAPWFFEHLETYERGSMGFAEWFDETMAATTTEAVLEHLARFGMVVRDAP